PSEEPNRSAGTPESDAGDTAAASTPYWRRPDWPVPVYGTATHPPSGGSAVAAADSGPAGVSGARSSPAGGGWSFSPRMFDAVGLGTGSGVAATAEPANAARRSSTAAIGGRAAG